MNLQEFTFSFLPQLVSLYEKGDFPFHALVDMDLWKQVFPPTQEKRSEWIWFQIRFNAVPLRKSTLLLIYHLPEPSQPNGVKYIVLLIDRKTRSTQYFTLERPQYYDDPWNICRIMIKDGRMSHSVEMELDGDPNLRNFVKSILQTFCKDTSFNFMKLIRDVYRTLFGMQEWG